MTTDNKRFGPSALLHAAVAAAVLTVPSAAGAQVHTSASHATARSAYSAAPRKVWEDRGPIQDLDLYWGSARPDRAPVGPFTFVREDMAATNPKADLRDANG